MNHSPTCSVCHQSTIGEVCGFCGNPICPECFSAGGGFCNAEHTQDQIDDYAVSTGYMTEEQCKRVGELRKAGIL